VNQSAKSPAAWGTILEEKPCRDASDKGTQLTGP
jgi:hypothetical protein